MKRENILKLSAATLAIIGTGCILFNAAAESVIVAKAGQVYTVSTSYQVPAAPAAVLPEPKTNGESVGAINYHLSMDSLNKETPTEKDLTMEEAAATGAQYLKDIFGLDLEGAYVYMYYSSGTETFPRAFWSADVLFEEAQTPESTRWTFFIDAVTGELFNIGHSRHLDASPSLAYNPALEKDFGIYEELAKQITENCNLLSGPIDRVEYNGQGYSGNDPDITMNAIGENGEIVIISFSRYDQALLGIITNSSHKISEDALDDLMKDWKEHGEDITMDYTSTEVLQVPVK